VPVARHPRRRGGVLIAVLLALVASALAPQAASAVNNGIDGVDGSLQHLADRQQRILAEHLGFSLRRLHLKVGWARFQKQVPNALTGTNSYVNGPIDWDGPICEIAVNKAWFEPLARSEQGEVLLHEIFHCFEYDIDPSSHSAKDWVLEGLARWADMTIYPDTHLAEAVKSLNQYYEAPQKSLFGRDYDAVGFWGHLADITGPLWRRVRAIVTDATAHGDDAALAVAMPASEEEAVLSSWGSSAFDLQDGAAPDWRMRSPLGARYFPSRHAPEAVSNTSSIELRPLSTTELSIGENAAAPLLQIHLDASTPGRFGVEENYSGSQLESKLFCAAGSPAACQCPAEDTGAVPATTPMPSRPLLGVAADRLGGQIQITYSSTDQYCKPKPPAPQELSGRSCDGLLPGYDTQIEGEFKATEAFVGTIASGTFVDTMTSVAAAEQDFKVRDVLGGSSAGVGEESSISSGGYTVNSIDGEPECTTSAVVRVRNVVAGFVIGGIESEACGGAATALLQAVAGEL
jgi:hypothetical protein